MLNASLNSYEIPLNESAILNPNVGLSLQSKRDCKHTFIGVVLAEIFWISIIITFSDHLPVEFN